MLHYIAEVWMLVQKERKKKAETKRQQHTMQASRFITVYYPSNEVFIFDDTFIAQLYNYYLYGIRLKYKA